MFQSNKNNRGRKSVGSMNKSQTKAARRVVLNWEGGLEERLLLTGKKVAFLVQGLGGGNVWRDLQNNPLNYK